MALPRTDLGEQLLAEGQALRALAASLLGRGSVSTTWSRRSYRLALAARAQPRADTCRMWLRVTLRHLARGWRRGEIRRVAREQVRRALVAKITTVIPLALAQQAEFARGRPPRRCTRSRSRSARSSC
jgi:hypothetical protein